MRILPLADIHGKFEIFDHIKKNYKKKDFDVITISGDIYEGSGTNGRYPILDLRDWCKKPIVITLGNHDKWDPRILKHDKNIHVLIKETVTIDGVLFYGSPLSPKFMNWAWMDTEDNLYNIWNSTMPDKVDVGLFHTPPRNYCDNVMQESYGHNADSHLGSEALLKIIEKRDIKYIFCGHIHTSCRKSTHPNGTKIFNCSCLSETYSFLEFNPPPEIITLDL